MDTLIVFTYLLTYLHLSTCMDQ